jgi:ribosomal protein S24E
MKIEIIEEKENPFFKRKEYKLLLRHENEATPSKNQLIEELKNMFGVDESKIKVDYIFGKKGVSESIAKVKVSKNEA